MAVVLTFSGTHPFRRQCATTRGSRVAELVAEDRCPRCEGPLYPPDREARARLCRPGERKPKWHPAGSRATACRCIPVCEVCQDAEALAPLVRELWLNGLDPYIDPEETDERRARWTADLAYVAETADAPLTQWPVDREQQIGGMLLVHAVGDLPQSPFEFVTWEEAVADPDLELRPHPGGWLDPDNY